MIKCHFILNREPIKRWLAKLGSERATNNIIKKTGGVLIAINNDINIYLLQGKRLKEFIEQDGLEVINKRFSNPKILVK